MRELTQLGVVLPVSPRQIVYANGTLFIEKISREADSGEYTCVATAGDETVRAKLQVNVLGKKKIMTRLSLVTLVFFA